jgi:membrane carboxypeptidase/penicillin-binding protein
MSTEMKKSYVYVLFGVLLGFIIVYYSTVVLRARHNTPQIVEDILNSESIKLQLSDLSQRQLDILLRVEDPNFFNHRGVDLKTPGAGLTTITQGLVKKLYFKEYKPGIRKLKQTLIARFALDPLVSKEDQLLMLINIFNFCYDAKGFSDAAYFYYKKPFQDLAHDEYISIVAMFVGCGVYNPMYNEQANSERVDRIKQVLSGEYVPNKMRDIYYSDDMHAFKIERKNRGS